MWELSLQRRSDTTRRVVSPNGRQAFHCREDAGFILHTLTSGMS